MNNNQTNTGQVRYTQGQKPKAKPASTGLAMLAGILLFLFVEMFGKSTPIKLDDAIMGQGTNT